MTNKERIFDVRLEAAQQWEGAYIKYVTEYCEHETTHNGKKTT